MLGRWAPSAELSSSDLGYVLRPVVETPELAGPVRRLGELVAGFLTSPDFHALSLCHGEGCGWFFLDRTPSRRRRWCSMEVCGNRAKAKRHYGKGRKAAE